MRLPERRRAVLIAGPTASGKSALALRLAERLGGTIINADAMQVYRDMRVLTARPGLADEARVPHRLYGTVDGATTWSVSRWLADLEVALAEAQADGRMPIIVGGTGLYFKALTQGLSEIPQVPDVVRAEVRGWATTHGPEALHAMLATRDPLTAARLRPTDPQRILRAIEVHHATGRSLASFHETCAAPLLDVARCTAISLLLDRETLRLRVDARFDTMMAMGALDEVTALGARALSPNLPIMHALGVPPLLRHLAGDMDWCEAVALGKGDTRRYLKRQETFMRHQLIGFSPMPSDRAEAFVLDQLV